MPTRKIARRRKALPVVAAVMQPVTKRLSRIEDLLTEIRYEQDVKHKKIAAIQVQLDELAETVKRRFQIV